LGRTNKLLALASGHDARLRPTLVAWPKKTTLKGSETRFMDENDSNVAVGFSQQLDQLASSAEEFNRLLNVFLGTVASMGVNPSLKMVAAHKQTLNDLEETRRRGRQAVSQLEQLQALTRTSTLLTSSLELDEVLEIVMDTVVDLTGAERAYLMLHKEGQPLSIRAARNWDRETIGEQDALFSRSVVQAAVEEKKAIITDNAQTDTRFGHQASILAQQVRSILCIPLYMQEQLVGVLYADNRFHKGIFSNDMLPVLTTFGTQAAIAIRNARQYGNVKENLAAAEQEIRRLRIAIDETKRQREVARIVDSDTFKELRSQAEAIRQRRKRRERE
jgi:transcriptional regulator with GAF, ATPase, and Fis domain